MMMGGVVEKMEQIKVLRFMLEARVALSLDFNVGGLSSSLIFYSFQC